MPKIDQQIGVVVKSTHNGERRRFSIEVDAPETLFQVTDILTAHGAARSLESILRDRTREAITDHLKATKSVLRTLAASREKRKPEATEPPSRISPNSQKKY